MYFIGSLLVLPLLPFACLGDGWCVKSVLALAKWIRVCAIYPRFAMNLTGLLCAGTIDQDRLHTCLTPGPPIYHGKNNKP